jgi:hypothetical protein
MKIRSAPFDLLIERWESNIHGKRYRFCVRRAVCVKSDTNRFQFFVDLQFIVNWYGSKWRSPRLRDGKGKRVHVVSFWIITPRSLVGGCQSSGGIFGLHHQGRSGIWISILLWNVKNYLPDYTVLDPDQHYIDILSMALQPFVGPWPLFNFLISYTVGKLLGREKRPSQGRYLHTVQHKHRINAHRHPCLKWDSNLRSQCSSGRRQFIS